MFLQPGVLFADNDEVTAQKLNDLVGEAIPQNYNRTHFAPDSRIVTVGTVPPVGPAAGELFHDTSESLLKVYDAPNSQFVGVAPEQEFILTSQDNLVAGDVVVLDTANASSVKTVLAAGDKDVLGVAKQPITGAPSSCRVQASGTSTVNCDAVAVNIGDYLVTSGTVQGKATPSAALIDGTFGRALTAKASGNGTVEAILFGQATVEVPDISIGIVPAGGATPEVFKTTDQNITTNQTWQEVTWDAVHSFETTVPNEVVMMSLSGMGLYSPTTGAGCAYRFTLNGTTEGSAIRFNGLFYGHQAGVDSGAMTGLTGEAGADEFSTILNMTIPIIVPTPSLTNRIRMYVRPDGAADVRVLVDDSFGGGGNIGAARLSIWKYAATVT